MNIKNNDLLSITVANSGDQKEYFPVNEFKADILADVEADKTLQDTIIQSILSTHQDTIIQSILGNVAAPVLATESTITENDNNPTIAIDVTKNTFIEGDSENAGNWIIDFGETNLILNTITKISGTKMKITTTGTAEEGTIRILALKDCFDSPIVDSTVLEIEVQASEE
jgi:hypothetical protein